MHPFVRDIKKTYEANRNPEYAVPMKQYMKGKFNFLGIKRPGRDQLNRPFFKTGTKPDKTELFDIVIELWNLPEREYQYFAMDLLGKYAHEPEKIWINDYEQIIKLKSWWDTVDYIAVNLVGMYMKKYTDQIVPVTKVWIESNNIWLQRTCLLFQLKYKKETNFELLDSFIQQCKDSTEFFINKAIGWSLREYSKTNPELVIEYVNKNEIAPFSKREALKVINRNKSR